MCSTKFEYKRFAQTLNGIDDIFAKYGIKKPDTEFKPVPKPTVIEEVEDIEPLAPALELSEIMNGSECYAQLIDLDDIYVDTARFQNRQGEFSEISANSVAKNLDWNIFDPIVVWKDIDGKIYVLSGHSRFEGLKRRKEKQVPARFFIGSEKEAMKYGKIIANRAAEAEGLLSDLKAFVLLRDGKNGLEKASKAELKNRFGKNYTQLENWSYLNPKGEFIGLLKQANKSAYPFIEKIAVWIGELRKELGENFTNIHERDCFYFFYGGHNYNIDKDSFFKIVRSKMKNSPTRLFPECSPDGCQDEQTGDRQLKQVNDQLKEAETALRDINRRFNSQNLVYTVEAEQEKTRLLSLQERYKAEINRLNNTIEQLQNQSKLF